MSDPDLTGKVCVITGASRGIGTVTARRLAEMGATVAMAGRDREALEKAADDVRAASSPDRVSVHLADFASLDEVRALGRDLSLAYPRIDALVNNAGLWLNKRAVSADGFEKTLAVNHLAPFLLTNLLLERLKASGPSRIVTVASQAHRGARLDLGDFTQPREWTPIKAYGRSKLANVLFTRALARRLDGSGLFTACLHPGVVATGIGNRPGGLLGFGWSLVKPFLISPEKGAATSLFLATVPDPAPFHGAYVIGKSAVDPDPAARDDDLGERLWAESARLVEV